MNIGGHMRPEEWLLLQQQQAMQRCVECTRSLKRQADIAGSLHRPEVQDQLMHICGRLVIAWFGSGGIRCWTGDGQPASRVQQRI